MENIFSLRKGVDFLGRVDEEHSTFGQRMADRVAKFGGSWTFILLFSFSIVVWIIIYTWFLLSGKSFDPYPFILLNLVLSCLAALQAPIIMMSQNRQADKDRLMEKNDYEVNLQAERDIRKIQDHLERILKELKKIRAEQVKKET